MLLGLLFLLWLIVAPLLIFGASIGGMRSRYRMVIRLTPLFCRSVARCCGIRVQVVGTVDPDTLLFVGNHVSWLDILTAGAAIGGVFVSRHDVANWPVLGIFARLAGTVFIDRTSLRSAVASSRAMVERVAIGIPVVFFPEGRAGDGAEVAPFKAFLFGGIVEEGTSVQPFTIDYTTIGRTPVTPENRDLVYWYRPDQDFLLHAWRLLSLRSVTCNVRMHPPHLPSADDDKREAARRFSVELRKVVASGVPVWGEEK